MKQSGTSTRLAGAVQGLTSELVSALQSGGPFRLAGRVDGRGTTADLALAAVRVVGADVVPPSALRCAPPPDSDDLAVFSKAVHAYPPSAGASPTSMWSHWAMPRAVLRLDASLDGASGNDREPEATWLDDAPWQFLTHQLAVLAPLALPGEDCAVARIARPSPRRRPGIRPGRPPPRPAPGGRSQTLAGRPRRCATNPGPGHRPRVRGADGLRRRTRGAAGPGGAADAGRSVGVTAPVRQTREVRRLGEEPGGPEAMARREDRVRGPGPRAGASSSVVKGAATGPV